jgi:hypothetical protein
MIKRAASIDVTDVTQLPVLPHIAGSNIWNGGYIGYTRPPRPASLPWIATLEELSTALAATPERESELSGEKLADIIAERREQLELGLPTTWFLRKWRALNGVRVSTYCRLNGSDPRQVSRALRIGEVNGVLEPITGKVLIPLWMPLAEGFSYDEIRRAARGELIFLSRFVGGISGVRS